MEYFGIKGNLKEKICKEIFKYIDDLCSKNVSCGIFEEFSPKVIYFQLYVIYFTLKAEVAKLFIIGELFLKIYKKKLKDNQNSINLLEKILKTYFFYQKISLFS